MFVERQYCSFAGVVHGQKSTDFINLLESNGLARPGGVQLAGRPLDLRQLRCDSYILAGRTDHITPWKGCYRTRALLGGHSDFVLCSSGHVQSIVSPPGNPKAGFLTGSQEDGTPEDFEANASTTEPATSDATLPRPADLLNRYSDPSRRRRTFSRCVHATNPMVNTPTATSGERHPSEAASSTGSATAPLSDASDT